MFDLPFDYFIPSHFYPFYLHNKKPRSVIKNHLQHIFCCIFFRLEIVQNDCIDKKKFQGGGDMQMSAEMWSYTILVLLTLTKMRTCVSPILYFPSDTRIIGNWVGHWHSDTSSRTWKKEKHINFVNHMTGVSEVFIHFIRYCHK